MKLFISLLVVFMMIGLVASPVMACSHDCDNCPSSGDCDHNHGDNCEGPDDDGNDNGSGSGTGGGCQGDSCQI